MHRFAKLFPLVLLTCVVGCRSSSAPAKPGPSSDECDALYGHKADLLAPHASAEAKSAARAVFVKSDVTTQWCESMSRSQYDCEMKAATKAALDACEDR